MDSGPGPRHGWRTGLALTGAFLAVLVLVVLRHEPWRDEVEFWLMASTSGSLAELRQNLHFANQTRLWPLLLFGVSRVFPQVEAMQVFHALLAAAAVWLFARHAPFTPRAKAVFAFGYYPFFEYAAIARSYALGVLLLFAACALMARPRRPYLALGLCLMLLAQTSAFAAILAVALSLAVAADDLLGRSADGPPPRPRRLALVLLPALAGLGFAIVQMTAPAGGTFTVSWGVSTDFDPLVRTASQLWRAYVPVPRPTLHFWNTNVLDGWTGAQAVLGLALASVAVWALRAWPSALVLYLAATGALLLFAHISPFTAARHNGHLYLAIVAAAWIASSARPWRFAALGGRWTPPAPGLLRAGCLAVLMAHLAAGAFAAGMDVRHPFSGGRRTAELLKANGYADAPLAVDPGFIGPPVAAHLGRPFYEPGSGRWGYFVVWDRQRGIERLEVPLAAQALAAEHGRPAILLSNRPIGRRRAPFTHLAEVAGCIVESEQYQVYLVPVPAS